ncbi:MAG: L-threonylcarbamoyladenylate synthase [Alphaproteobacteria bacterium]|nr:L-threonylcarbamoyladenylate synthase [Alphaproteobacteria bacterium]
MGGLWKSLVQKFFKASLEKNGSFWRQDRLSFWVQELRKGEVVVAPAESVYGYCCDPFNEGALRKLMSIKNRPVDKGMIVLVGSTKQLYRFVEKSELSQAHRDAMKKYWPGPYTLILPAKNELPDLITGSRNTVAIRMPRPIYMREYLRVWTKGLVSSSLNESGAEPVRDAEEIPHGPVALEMSRPLRGKPSKIYDPEKNAWIR